MLPLIYCVLFGKIITDHRVWSKKRAEWVNLTNCVSIRLLSWTKGTGAGILVVKRYKFALRSGRERYKRGRDAHALFPGSSSLDSLDRVMVSKYLLCRQGN
jgi:hypothetical protein